MRGYGRGYHKTGGLTDAQKRRLKAFDQAVARCRKKLSTSATEATPGEEAGVWTIDAIEQLSMELRDELGKALVQELTQAEADAAEEEEGQAKEGKRACKVCERSVGFRGSRQRTVVTMAGVVKLNRRAYYCKRCDCCTYPLDTALEVPYGAFTARVQRAVAWLSAQGTFRQAVRTLSTLGGVHVSAKQAERIAEEAGEWANQQLAADIAKVFPQNAHCPHLRQRYPDALAEQLHDPRYTGYVMMDGAMTPLKGKEHWNESKMGTVCLTEGRASQTQQPRIVHRLYTHHLGGAEQLGRQVYTLAARARITGLSRLGIIGDGAAWLWTQASLLFPHALQILDWNHAMEYLWAVGRTCLNEKGVAEKQAEQRIWDWVKEGEKLLWEGQVKEVMRRVDELPKSTPEAREAIRSTLVYYQNQQSRMRYDQYRREGYWIGSGMMESTCKQIVTTRLKAAGMRWTERGAQAIGGLRALFLSEKRWDEVMDRWPGRQIAPVALS